MLDPHSTKCEIILTQISVLSPAYIWLRSSQAKPGCRNRIHHSLAKAQIVHYLLAFDKFLGLQWPPKISGDSITEGKNSAMLPITIYLFYSTLLLPVLVTIFDQTSRPRLPCYRYVETLA